LSAPIITALKTDLFNWRIAGLRIWIATSQQPGENPGLTLLESGIAGSSPKLEVLPQAPGLLTDEGRVYS
jgi:hypothetical protein